MQAMNQAQATPVEVSRNIEKHVLVDQHAQLGDKHSACKIKRALSTKTLR